MAYKKQSVNKRVDKLFYEAGKRWSGVLSYCETHPKYKMWRDKAEECLSFYHGQDDTNPGKFFIYGAQDEPAALKDNPFRLTVNKVFEFVRTVEPELYYRDPSATIVPRRRAPEAAAQIAELLEDVVAYYLEEMDTFAERRAALKDALIMGRGVVFTGAKRLEDGTLFPYEERVSALDFLCDPDAQNYRSITWMAHRKLSPKSELVEMYGDRVQKYFGDDYSPSELIEWWEIYTKNGLFAGLSDEKTDQLMVDTLENNLGKHLKICMIRNPNKSQKPLPDMGGAQELLTKTPCPAFVMDIKPWDYEFWKEAEPRNAWAYTLIDFYPQEGSVYPMPPTAPALGQQRALNWAFVFLLNSMRNTSRSLVQLAPGMNSPETLSAIQNGMNMAIIEGSEADMDAFKVTPLKQDNSQLWNEFQIIANQFDMNVGLLDMRSAIVGNEARTATAAENKEAMATKTVDAFFSVASRAFTQTTRKLSYVIRVEATPEDIQSILSPEETLFWFGYHQQYGKDPIRDLDVQIWSDGMRRPTKDAIIQQTSMMFEQVKSIAPMIGDFDSLNAWWLKLQKVLGVPPSEATMFTDNRQPAPSPEEQAMAAEEERQSQLSPEEQLNEHADQLIQQLPPGVDVVDDTETA